MLIVEEKKKSSLREKDFANYIYKADKKRKVFFSYIETFFCLRFLFICHDKI